MRAKTALMSGLAAIALLLLSNVAGATDYTFPNFMPAGCNGTAGVYTCGPLSLGWGDTITIEGTKPATITINGVLNTSTSTINAATGAQASDLNLVVSGALTTGFQTVLNANVTAASVDASGGGTEVTFGGALAATGGAINLGYRTTVAGSVSTAGSITLGNESKVNGRVNGGAGNVEVGFKAQVGGAITTTTGTIFIDNESVVSACVMSSGSAAITLDYHAQVDSVCCGSGCNNLCVSNGSAYAMPRACVIPGLAKSASASAVAVGSSLSFNLVATNPSTTALNSVEVTDVIPSGMNYSAAASTLGSASVSGQTLTWSIPMIPPNSSAQLTLAVKPTQQGTFTNTITAPGAAAASATVLVLPSAFVHFRMDEASNSWTGTAGEVKDSGSYTLNGYRTTAPNTTTTTNTTAPAETIASQHAIVGGFCNAGKFDGKGVVVTPSNNYFNFDKTLSASIWINPAAFPTSDYYAILSNDVNYEFHIDQNKRLYWWWQDSAGNNHTLTSKGKIDADEWTHVAITMDATPSNHRQRIYINGKLDDNAGSWSGLLATNKCPFYIGGDINTGSACSLATGRNFRGMLDEAKLYNYELTSDEVKADMTLGRQCGGVFDHIRIEHDGSASACSPKTVRVKACLDASCSSLYTGTVTAKLTPSGWGSGDTVTINNGVTTATLSNDSIDVGTLTLGGSATGTVLPSSLPVRCFDGATETCELTVPSVSCKFDAVEVSAKPQTNLFTKRAGTAFSVDVLALNNPTTIDQWYSGTVTVALMDKCPDGNVLSTTQPSVTFNWWNGDRGRKSVSLTTATAISKAQVRIKAGNASACSYDKLAVRPSAVTLASSDANAYTYSASAAPGNATMKKIKAGANFKLGATTTPSAYSGTLKLDVNKLTAQSTTLGTAPQSGGTVGTLGASTVTANAGPIDTTYSEVGYLYLAPGAYRDEEFTAVDSAVGDCVTTTVGDGNLADTLAGGKYGCHIGNKATVALGRFIPDHFALTPDAAVPACSNVFTYFGQDGFTTPFKLTAQNSTNGTTRNYANDFARLGSWDGSTRTWAWDDFVFSASPLPDGSELQSSATAPTGDWVSGRVNMIAKHQVSRPTDLAGPTLVNVSAKPVDDDGVTTAAATLVATNATPLRYGRLRQLNAYGSELLPLPVPLTVEYWNGTMFNRNVDDGCTLLETPASSSELAQFLTNSGSTTAQMKSPLVGGDAAFRLTAPGAGSHGYVDIRVKTPQHLQFNWKGTGDTGPAARATFGIYKSPLIYRRESY